LILQPYDIAASDQEGWSNILELAATSMYCLGPRVAVDSKNNIHLLWTDKIVEDQGGVLYMKLDERGRTLINTTMLTNGTYSSHPAVTIDSQDNIHLVWMDKVTDDKNEVLYMKLDERGSELIERKKIIDYISRSDQPAIAIDSENNIHMVWRDNIDGRPRVYYMKLDERGQVLVNTTRLTNGTYSFYPTIAIDSRDNIHIICWDRGKNWDVSYFKLDKEGNVLIGETKLAESRELGKYGELDIAIDSKDNINIVFTYKKLKEQDEVLYMKLDKNGVKLIENTRPVHYEHSFLPSISVDSECNVHLVWTDGRFHNLEICYMRLDEGGMKLIDTTRVTKSWAGSWRPSIMIDSKDKIHLTWMRFSQSGFDILYKDTVAPIPPSILSSFLNRFGFENGEDALVSIAFYSLIAFGYSIILLAVIPGNLITIILGTGFVYIMKKFHFAKEGDRTLLLVFIVVSIVKLILILFRLPPFIGTTYHLITFPLSIALTLAFIKLNKLDPLNNIDLIVSLIVMTFFDTYLTFIPSTIKRLHYI